jgi:hypothetical protein
MVSSVYIIYHIKYYIIVIHQFLKLIYVDLFFRLEENIFQLF